MRALFLTLLALPLLSGCATVAFTAASESAIIAGQERTFGESIDDRVIFTRIKERYFQKDVHDLLINVGIEVVESRVLLTGSVMKPETAVEAVRLAWQVPGVREVTNEIQVNDKSGLTDYAKDSWITWQIRSRMLVAKNIRGINYSVETVNQSVYIIGIAQEQNELDAVLNIARTTKYVKEVINHVRFKDDPRRPRLR